MTSILLTRWASTLTSPQTTIISTSTPNKILTLTIITSGHKMPWWTNWQFSRKNAEHLAVGHFFFIQAYPLSHLHPLPHTCTCMHQVCDMHTWGQVAECHDRWWSGVSPGVTLVGLQAGHWSHWCCHSLGAASPSPLLSAWTSSSVSGTQFSVWGTCAMCCGRMGCHCSHAPINNTDCVFDCSKLKSTNH